MFKCHMTISIAVGVVAVLLVGLQVGIPQSLAENKKQTLYDQLGGLAPISVVVSDFIDALVDDTTLN